MLQTAYKNGYMHALEKLGYAPELIARVNQVVGGGKGILGAAGGGVIGGVGGAVAAPEGQRGKGLLYGSLAGAGVGYGGSRAAHSLRKSRADSVNDYADLMLHHGSKHPTDQAIAFEAMKRLKFPQDVGIGTAAGAAAGTGIGAVLPRDKKR